MGTALLTMAASNGSDANFGVVSPIAISTSVPQVAPFVLLPFTTDHDRAKTFYKNHSVLAKGGKVGIYFCGACHHPLMREIKLYVHRDHAGCKMRPRGKLVHDDRFDGDAGKSS